MGVNPNQESTYLAVFIRKRIEREHLVFVIVLGKIEKDSSRLKDLEAVAIVVYDGGDTTIGVDLD